MIEEGVSSPTLRNGAENPVPHRHWRHKGRSKRCVMFTPSVLIECTSRPASEARADTSRIEQTCAPGQVVMRSEKSDGHNSARREVLKKKVDVNGVKYMLSSGAQRGIHIGSIVAVTYNYRCIGIHCLTFSRWLAASAAILFFSASSRSSFT